VSEDHQWIHVDPDRAVGSVFGSTIAHGYLTITVVGTLLGELLQVDDDLVMVNYGLDRLRFINPVCSGSLLRAHAVIRDVHETTTGLKLLLDVTGEIDGSNDACYAVAIVLVQRESARPSN
jgi:acyl dehydratase